MALYSLEAGTPHPQKGAIKLYMAVFQIAVRGWGESEILLGGIFLPDEENLTSSDLDDLFLSGGGRDKNLVEEGVFFYEEIFLGGGTLPHSLQWEKTCIYIYIY